MMGDYSTEATELVETYGLSALSSMACKLQLFLFRFPHEVHHYWCVLITHLALDTPLMEKYRFQVKQGPASHAYCTTLLITLVRLFVPSCDRDAWTAIYLYI